MMFMFETSVSPILVNIHEIFENVLGTAHDNKLELLEEQRSLEATLFVVYIYIYTDIHILHIMCLCIVIYVYITI